MNKSDSTLAALNARLKAMPHRKRIRQADSGAEITAGQIWSPAAAAGVQKEETPTWLLLIVELLEKGLFNAIPVFRWTELAGPCDLILPSGVAGARMAAALDLKSTIERSMLLRCEARFPETVMKIIAAAQTVMDDPIERHGFQWGLNYLGHNDHRISYHHAIADTLETMQAGVREMVYAGDADINDFPFPSLEFERFASRLAAADSGALVTPCVILREPSGARKVVREDNFQMLLAKCRVFDALIPDNREPVCCEWIIESGYNEIPASAEALVYDSRTEKRAGRADVDVRPDAILVTLTAHILSGDALPVEDPRVLRIVIKAKES